MKRDTDLFKPILMLVAFTAIMATLAVNVVAGEVKTTMQASATVTYKCTISVQNEVFIPCREPSYPEKILIMEGARATLKRDGNYMVVYY